MEIGGLGALASMVEAILFSAADPISVERLAEVLGTTVPLVRQALSELGAHLDAHGHSVGLVEIAGGVQLLTRGEYGGIVARMTEVKPVPLSRAALETLAIVALRQPITRAAIDELRGVHSDGAVATLVERGLISEKGRSNGPGRAFLYGTTERFLQHFGLRSIQELQGELPETLVESLQTASRRPRRLFQRELP